MKRFTVPQSMEAQPGHINPEYAMQYFCSCHMVQDGIAINCKDLKLDFLSLSIRCKAKYPFVHTNVLYTPTSSSIVFTSNEQNVSSAELFQHLTKCNPVPYHFISSPPT